MRFSYNWLKDLSKTEKSPEDLAEMVILKGFELEEQISLASVFKNFIVGEVVEIKNHPDADRLRIVWLDLGKFGEKVQIVCGAPNVEVGQKVAVALVGAVLPNSKIEIKKSKIRGVESNGMICAEDELGLGKDHQGIMVLNDDLKVGTFLIEALKLKDEVLDFDILPNRSSDCLSYIGMAREISAMEKINTDLNTDLNTDFPSEGKLLDIKIKDEKLCSRYMGAVLKNIKIKKSPDWMQARLIASGMEPINNIVDITNYVMLETGSPLHAFDFNQIKNQEKVEIVVRKAEKDEKMELLSDINLDLNEDDLVISNGQESLALAGIKGGKKSGINIETNKIVLEGANFDPLSIRKSRQRHSLVTESQSRFEKGVSPVLAQVAVEKAIELLKEYAEAELVEVVDCNKIQSEKQIIKFNTENIEKLLGEKVKNEEAFEILENLGFKIKNKDKKEVEIDIPYWRLDIEDQADFIEEIGRIKGYEEINEQYLMTACKPNRRNLKRELEWKIKDNLKALGFDELINYSFYSEKDLRIGKISGKHFELKNPNSEKQNLMRRTLLVEIIKATKNNQKHFERFNIFEIGKVFFPENKLAEEELKISGANFDENLEIIELFYQTKEEIKTLLGQFSEQIIQFESFKKSENDFYHTSRKAKILINGKRIGELGQINIQVAKDYKIKKPFILFELDFESLFELNEIKKEFKTLQKFPFVERDLAIYVEKRTEVKEIEILIKEAGGKYLKKLELFDIFENKENDKKSLAFHLSFSKEDATLKGIEVDEKIEKINQALAEKNYEIRKA
jgi:phenylalanyl-tRNA synthetase beta chain